MTWVGISVARVTRAHYRKLILFGFGHIVFNNILVTNLLKIILTGQNLYLFFLDMRRDVQEIFRATPHEKQVMMFSATISTDIRPVCKKFMQDVSKSGTIATGGWPQILTPLFAQLPTTGLNWSHTLPLTTFICQHAFRKLTGHDVSISITDNLRSPVLVSTILTMSSWRILRRTGSTSNYLMCMSSTRWELNLLCV